MAEKAPDNKISKIEKEGLIEAFGLEEDEAFEAGFNLLGFFEVLQKIKERLETEKLKRKKEND